MYVVLFGYLSGIFAFIACIPYIHDILLKKTKPHRVTFLIWSILGIIAFFSQLAKGASNSLWLPGIDTVGVVFIFILSLKYGTGGHNKLDTISLFVSLIGLLVWHFTKDAVYALFIVIFIDAVGSFLTVRKSFHDPQSETTSAWIFSALSGSCALVAVGTFNIVLVSYPLYIILSNAAVVIAMQAGKKRVKH